MSSGDEGDVKAAGDSSDVVVGGKRPRTLKNLDESQDDDGLSDDDDDGDNGFDDNEDADAMDEEEDGDSKGKAKSKAKAKPKAKAKAPPKKKTKANDGKSTKSSASKSTKTSKTSTKKTATTTTKKKTAAAKASPKKEAPARKPKELTKADRMEEARRAYKWWEDVELPKDINWRTLEHAGIVFPEEYIRHNKPLLYDGKPIHLPSELEEIATFYAAMPEDGPQLGGSSRETFQKNFFKDFKESLGPSHEIQEFSKCDFTEIRKHLDLQKALKKAATDEQKALNKAAKDANVLAKGYAIVDGRLEKMGNFNMEPPGLFRGRGEHPLTGTVKRRTLGDSVSLNMGYDAPVPRCDLPGSNWKLVQHDPSVTWLLGWNENVQDSNKYVHLAASSSFKGKSDRDKYSKAIELARCIESVRKDYRIKIRSSDKLDRQLGIAMWVIDVLALRVGGEKGEDEADTVGCCSLRKEHFTFNADPETFEVDLEFLGKDSMQFKQTIKFAEINHPSGDIGKEVYRCLVSFNAGKSPNEEVFDQLTPTILNSHLSSLMPGLSAKVFRTFNASITLEKELPTAAELSGMTVAEKVIKYNDANREVAILCNHQKTVSKAQETQLEASNAKLEQLREQKEELQAWLKLAKNNKSEKIPVKKDDSKLVEKLASEHKNALHMKNTAVTDGEKVAAVEAVDAAKAAIKVDASRKFSVQHQYKTKPSADQLDKKIKTWDEKISKMEVDIRNKDDNKEVSLGTSKINYMDPRISVAWCKRVEVPIDKVFAKTLRDKFNWAMAVSIASFHLPSLSTHHCINTLVYGSKN